MELESQSTDADSDYDQYYDESDEDDDNEIQYYEYGQEVNVTAPVNGFVRKPISHLNHMVQDDAHDVYDFKAFSVINITFGLLDGALNAMPRGGFLYECGENNQK